MCTKQLFAQLIGITRETATTLHRNVPNQPTPPPHSTRKKDRLAHPATPSASRPLRHDVLQAHSEKARCSLKTRIDFAHQLTHTHNQSKRPRTLPTYVDGYLYHVIEGSLCLLCCEVTHIFQTRKRNLEPAPTPSRTHDRTDDNGLCVRVST